MRKKINFHYVILGIVALIVLIVAFKLFMWNRGIKDNTVITSEDSDTDIEVMDYILPLHPSLLEGREDDGILSVLCLGNEPFADDRNDENNLTKLMEKELGENAKVYNASFKDSYMTALKPSFSEEHVYDAFSFYWLSTVLAVDNDQLLDRALNSMEEVPEDFRESVELIKSIDMDKIDVIAIMYDGNDYLAGRRTIDTENPTDIQTFTGALAAGIQLFQQTYPHIRIMVMSPTYAYGLDENGEYVSSDIMDYGMGSLATYAILESDTCYENSVSYIDNLYGSVNVNDADRYLKDYIHLNEKGRQVVARRFAECLNLYQGVKPVNAE